MATAPQTTPYDSDGIREGGSLFRIPSSGTNRVDLPFDQAVGHQRHQRKLTEQCRRGPSNGLIIPLSLSFYRDMRSGFLKGYLHAPTAHEPSQDLQRRMIGVRRNKGLRLEFALRVAYQHPMNQDRLV